MTWSQAPDVMTDKPRTIGSLLPSFPRGSTNLKALPYPPTPPPHHPATGPGPAVPRALARAGLAPAAVALVDLPEASAAQVLSATKARGSAAFARARPGREEAVGDIDPARLNVHGGSLALGHPFGATGARMVTTMANALARTGKRTAVLGICAAGGLGAAAVLERFE